MRHSASALASWRSTLHREVLRGHDFRSSAVSLSAFRRTSPLLSSETSEAPAKKRWKTSCRSPPDTSVRKSRPSSRKRFDMDPPVGPFGTKEAPAVIPSYYDKRIVGCPGGEGEDEHDVVWFWLEKDKPHECPVCSQYFVLKVIGEGGPPDGHGDDDHH